MFTRAVDNDQSPEIDAGDLTYVVAGTVNGGDGYVQTASNITVGTTAVVWTQFSGAGAVPLATISSVGIASFPSAQFSVSGAGAVQIDNLSGNLVTSGTVADGRIASALTSKTYNGLTLTAASTGFTVAGGTTSKTLTVSNTLTLQGTDSSTLNIGTGGTLGSAAFTATSAYLAAGVTSLPSVTSVNSTTIPNAATLLVSGGALGTPSSATLTNATGLPVAGISNLGANVGAFLITPSSANLRAALSDESGSGALVFAGGDIGAATATTATAGNSSTLVATTAFVAAAVTAGAGSGVKRYTATNASLTPSSGEVTWTVSAGTHGIGAIGSIIPSLKEVSTGATVEPDFFINDTSGDVTVKWNASATVTAGVYRLTLLGA